MQHAPLGGRRWRRPRFDPPNQLGRKFRDEGKYRALRDFPAEGGFGKGRAKVASKATRARQTGQKPRLARITHWIG